jgi:recombination DNA repair RAD52 pathway protein
MKKVQSKEALTIYQGLKIDSFIKPEQIIHFLQKTPKEHIYSRPAKGGGTWDYVTGTYIKKSLNYSFGFMWSSEVKEVKEKYGQVVATVRVTIHSPAGTAILWKEDIGKKDIVFKKGTQAPLDYGNDEKAAVTDGIKRCAAQFGIASDIYGKEEFKQLELEKVVVEDKVGVLKNGDDPATSEQIDTLAKLGFIVSKIEELTYTKQMAADKIAELLEAKK